MHLNPQADDVLMFLQTAAETGLPDSEEPEPDAPAAFIARPLPPQHPRLKSDIMPHLSALQQGGHAALQLYIW